MISPAAYALIVSMIYFACMAVATVVLGATQPWKGREDLDVDAVNRFAVVFWPVTAVWFSWVGLWRLGPIIRKRLEARAAPKSAFSINCITFATKKATPYRDGRFSCRIVLPAGTVVSSDGVCRVEDGEMRLVEADAGGPLCKESVVDTVWLLRRLTQAGGEN